MNAIMASSSPCDSCLWCEHCAGRHPNHLLPEMFCMEGSVPECVCTLSLWACSLVGSVWAHWVIIIISYHRKHSDSDLSPLPLQFSYRKGVQTAASSLIDLSAVFNHGYIIFVSTSDVHDSISNLAEGDALSSFLSFIFNDLFKHRII